MRTGLQDCPNGCGHRHRGAPTPTNCSRYPTTTRGVQSTSGALSGLGRKSLLTTGAPTPQVSSLSAALNDNGTPMTLYHGTDIDFENFDPEFTGSGNDAYGSGFYFTDSADSATGYGSTVKQVHLDIRDPYRIDGEQPHIDDSVSFTAAQAATILKHHPDIHVQPDDDQRYNPLGDYVSEYWEREHWSDAELDRMAERMAGEYLTDVPFSSVESIFEAGDSAHFRRGVTEATGHDGVVVDCTDGTQHWIAWFPEQIVSR